MSSNPVHCLDRIVAALRTRRGIDFGGYRRSTLERRLGARMTALGVRDPLDYLARLESDPEEPGALVAAFSINCSSFFRDPVVFEILAQSVLPEILERKARTGSRELRVWSAGCAAGEEAYTLAILVHRAIAVRREEWTGLIIATDIDDGALVEARRGRYALDCLDAMRIGFLQDSFVESDGQYQVRPVIHEMVHFATDDLTAADLRAPADSVFGAFDLVACRNVLIYFDRALQDRVLDKLHGALGIGACLVLGSAETIPRRLEQKLEIIDGRNRIYRRVR